MQATDLEVGKMVECADAGGDWLKSEQQGCSRPLWGFRVKTALLCIYWKENFTAHELLRAQRTCWTATIPPGFLRATVHVEGLRT